MVLCGGTLLQTSCTGLGAEVTAGLTTSIANQFIRNIIYQSLNVGGGSFGGF
jgi:hypothetical protein